MRVIITNNDKLALFAKSVRDHGGEEFEAINWGGIVDWTVSMQELFSNE